MVPAIGRSRVSWPQSLVWRAAIVAVGHEDPPTTARRSTLICRPAWRLIAPLPQRMPSSTGVALCTGRSLATVAEVNQALHASVGFYAKCRMR
jgi:hypothetical protein